MVSPGWKASAARSRNPGFRDRPCVGWVASGVPEGMAYAKPLRCGHMGSSCTRHSSDVSGGVDLELRRRLKKRPLQGLYSDNQSPKKRRPHEAGIGPEMLSPVGLVDNIVVNPARPVNQPMGRIVVPEDMLPENGQ